jgi:hypothetical protein
MTESSVVVIGNTPDTLIAVLVRAASEFGTPSGLVGCSGPAGPTVGEPVGVAVEGYDVGVVDVAVDDVGGDLVGEDVAPAAEGPVRGDDGGCGLVAGRRQVKDQVGGAGVERDVTDLVDDQLGVISSPPSGSSSRRARPAVPASRCCCIPARFSDVGYFRPGTFEQFPP